MAHEMHTLADVTGFEAKIALSMKREAAERMLQMNSEGEVQNADENRHVAGLRPLTKKTPSIRASVRGRRSGGDGQMNDGHKDVDKADDARVTRVDKKVSVNNDFPVFVRPGSASTMAV